MYLWGVVGFFFSYLGCCPHTKFYVPSSGTCVCHYKWKLSYCNAQTSGFESTAEAEHSFLRQEKLLVTSKALLFFTPGALIVCLTLSVRTVVKHAMRLWRRGRERGHSWASQKAKMTP